MHRRPILLVEDNPDDAFLFKRCIDGVGKFELFLVGNGNAAIRFLESARTDPETKPVAIFVDLGMPGMDGLELLGWLEGRPELANVPRFAVSGAGDDRQAKAVLRGAQSFLEKPVNATELAFALMPI